MIYKIRDIKKFDFVINNGKPEWGIGLVLLTDNKGRITTHFSDIKKIKKFKYGSYLKKVEVFHLPNNNRSIIKSRCGLTNVHIFTSPKENDKEYICPLCTHNLKFSTFKYISLERRDPTLNELRHSDIKELMKAPIQRKTWDDYATDLMVPPLLVRMLRRLGMLD